MRIFTFAFLSAIAGTALAGDLCAPHVEESDNWHTARFRSHVDAFRECPVSESVYRRVLEDWFAGRRKSSPINSIALGRAINYPWLSEYIARAALGNPKLQSALGEPGRTNRFVAALLSEEDMQRRLDRPFLRTPYRVVSVEVEKVLVDEAGKILGTDENKSARVPFDAQVWLNLGQR